MSGKCGKEVVKRNLWKSEINVNSHLSTTESKDQNELNNCSVISDWSRTEDDYSESDVGQFMHTLFRKQLYTDVTFYPKIGKETLSAHRVVLAAKCEFFAELLFGKKTKEVEDMKMKEEISIVPFNIFKMIVEYFYTDEINLNDVPTMLDIFWGAKHFQVHSLVARCESHIESLELTEDNVCSILQMHDDIDIEELKNRCLFYIQENTEKVISSKTFHKCTYDIIYVICKLPALSLNSEEQLIDAVAGWIHVHASRYKPQQIMPLLSSIRLLTLSAEEFGSIIRKHCDLMTVEDALEIMMYLNASTETRSFQKLPAWCNKTTQRRCFKQDNTESVLKDNSSVWDVRPVGKVIFPLRSTDDSSITQNMSELTSLLQMKCISGHHQIKAIKLAFQEPVSDRSVIKNIVIRVHVSPSRFNIFEHIEIANSLEVTVPFSRVIKARRGDLVDIEVEAKNMKFYRFLQFDEACSMPLNRHFQCFVASRPKCGKLYFIKEVEYGPQDIPRAPQRLGDNRRHGNRQ